MKNICSCRSYPSTNFNQAVMDVPLINHFLFPNFWAAQNFSIPVGQLQRLSVSEPGCGAVQLLEELTQRALRTVSKICQNQNGGGGRYDRY